MFVDRGVYGSGWVGLRVFSIQPTIVEQKKNPIQLNPTYHRSPTQTPGSGWTVFF